MAHNSESQKEPQNSSKEDFMPVQKIAYKSYQISKKIEIPVLREVEMYAEDMEILAPANGNARVVYIDLLNLGNDDEAYSLDLVQSNWK